jgi:C_GCAxxG_C_C family probable redox protein
MNVPTLTTARMILRAFTAQDVDPLHQILGGKDVLRYFPNPKPPSREQVQKLIAFQLEHWKNHRFGWWAVVLRETDELIGWCGLQFLPETGETEVAYLLGREHWGRGLATEAARVSLRYGFEDLGIERIIALTHLENAASQRVIEKLGLPFVDQAQYFGMACRRYALARADYGRARVIDETAQRARQYFASRDYYCAESVLLAMAEAHGIQSDFIPRIATGFCSGVARTCRTCGAVSGAIMGLSLLKGRSAPGAPVDEYYALVRELLERFEDKFGSMNCEELTGCDLGTQEGQAFFRANDVLEQCLRYTEEATRIAMALIKG